MNAPVISARHLSKRFGDVLAVFRRARKSGLLLHIGE